MTDPFKPTDGRKLLVEQCYVCSVRQGCLLILLPERRVSTFKDSCASCPRLDKPDCLVNVHNDQAMMPALCLGCAKVIS